MQDSYPVVWIPPCCPVCDDFTSTNNRPILGTGWANTYFKRKQGVLFGLVVRAHARGVLGANVG